MAVWRRTPSIPRSPTTVSLDRVLQLLDRRLRLLGRLVRGDVAADGRRQRLGDRLEVAHRADQRDLVLLEAPALEGAPAGAQREDRRLGVELAQRGAPVHAALELGPAARVA